MLQIKVVLVDATGEVAPDKMAAAAEALSVQVTRDLPQFWNVQAPFRTGLIRTASRRACGRYSL
jgi:hypothetical protein